MHDAGASGGGFAAVHDRRKAPEDRGVQALVNVALGYLQGAK
jgi:hypothetical protein